MTCGAMAHGLRLHVVRTMLRLFGSAAPPDAFF